MQIDINTKKYELNDDIKKYVDKKIGKLSRKLPRKVRDSVHAKVTLKERPARKTDKFACEVRLALPPKHEFVVEEATINMFAAIDIVEAKLSNQLSKFHAKEVNHRVDRKGVLGRIRSVTDREFWRRQN